MVPGKCEWKQPPKPVCDMERRSEDQETTPVMHATKTSIMTCKQNAEKSETRKKSIPPEI